ncbi:hypothetical protein HDU84_001047 [Entophlyctis sp. JEL0112]|nr:hypothetical protein HDU84_001047 [Entophlyctis sp. JEL0112]
MHIHPDISEGRQFAVPVDVAYQSGTLQHIHKSQTPFKEGHQKFTILPFEEHVLEQILCFLYLQWMEANNLQVPSEFYCGFHPNLEDILILMDAAMYLDIFALVNICSKLAAENFSKISSFENLSDILTVDILKKVDAFNLLVAEKDPLLAHLTRDFAKIMRMKFRLICEAKMRADKELSCQELIFENEKASLQAKKAVIAQALSSKLSDPNLCMHDLELLQQILSSSEVLLVQDLEFTLAPQQANWFATGLLQCMVNLQFVSVHIHIKIIKSQIDLLQALLYDMKLKLQLHLVFHVAGSNYAEDVELLTKALGTGSSQEGIKASANSGFSKKAILPAVKKSTDDKAANGISVLHNKGMGVTLRSDESSCLSWRDVASAMSSIFSGRARWQTAIEASATRFSKLILRDVYLGPNGAAVLAERVGHLRIMQLDVARTQAGARGVAALVRAAGAAGIIEVDVSGNVAGAGEDASAVDAYAGALAWFVAGGGCAGAELRAAANACGGGAGGVAIARGLARSELRGLWLGGDASAASVFGDLCLAAGALLARRSALRRLGLVGIRMSPRLLARGLVALFAGATQAPVFLEVLDLSE